MKIVITDAGTVFDREITADVFGKYGEVEQYHLLTQAELAEKTADADIVLCNKSLFDEKTLKNARRLKYIGLFATGYNNIDIDYCRRHGIAVCNAGSYSTAAVTQHTFALILEHFSNVGRYDEFVRLGGWKRSETFSPFACRQNELFGKTIGIVGFGNIGSSVAKAAAAFGMNTVAYSRSEKTADGVRFVPFDELLSVSDIVSVHCPLNDESRGMFGKKQFEMMKRSALFVNTARGGVMNEQELFDALESGEIGGAAIDTLSVEPMEEDCILMNAKNCIITPHVAWAPIETRQRLIGIVADNIEKWLACISQNRIV